MLNLHKIKEFQDIFSFLGKSCKKILISVILNDLEAFGKKKKAILEIKERGSNV